MDLYLGKSAFRGTHYLYHLNKLYFGDNLDILREHIADESVDLIYLGSAAF